MRTYEEAFAAARDEPAFSNGTEGYAWQGQWCDRCVHDASVRNGDGSGCPLVMVALMGRTPSEWLEQPWQQVVGRPAGVLAPSLGDTYHCVEFRNEDDPGPGYEPVEPVSPDQLELFDADTWRRPRMYGPVCDLVNA
jgi:hypothetical protein